jgi:hypothetical protein
MVEEVNDFILKNDFNNAKLQDTKMTLHKANSIEKLTQKLIS